MPGTPSCSIQLSGVPAEVEPGQTVENLRAEVTCNGVATAVPIQLEVNAKEQTGGHNHVGDAAHPRPPGSLTPAGGASPLTFAFTAPAPAGDHTITARCADRDCGVAEGEVWVGYKDLVNIPPSDSYALTETVGGQTGPIGASGSHPANHYLTQEALERLVIIAGVYKEIYPNNPRLHLNDASLERGGVYDITNTWAKPHQCHSRGHGIDVRANDKQGAIPKQDRKEFKKFIQQEAGLSVGHEDPGGANEHFHLYLLQGRCER
jgi:hypothetical protein